ncbi:GNAT family N-acetyltransferase [Budviciaceae bacterium BWR-B9]|uniref:GNAT family N-acetyltransferase n=1 Tax=Limnobaculum allomyrinae TaxID=2791986 RepID=A0ABS1IL85_9GAMM|nr:MULTISPECIES: GNAT family protein [Limnobaculum]MBK5142444.1 GNAT family N-acetyltransferase [Limnobaculum allomyrinae]MBV7690671.1 GNAT family N-acetyltransferase [Limnobaculum sp. M2-1]
MEIKKLSYDYVSDIAIFANNKKIADNLRDIFPHPYTEENARQFVEFCIDTPESKQVNRAIFHDDKAVGVISLTLGEDVYAKSAEIGYWLAELYWGKGIMTDAARQMCCIAFGQYNLARLFAAVYSYNKESCKVLEKCGFEMEGVLKKSVFKNGQFFDSYMYGLVN